jgi:hypothetical protein
MDLLEKKEDAVVQCDHEFVEFVECKVKFCVKCDSTFGKPLCLVWIVTSRVFCWRDLG